MRNLLVRTLSGVVLTVVVVGAVLWSQWSFGVLLLAILVGGIMILVLGFYSVDIVTDVVKLGLPEVFLR